MGVLDAQGVVLGAEYVDIVSVLVLLHTGLADTGVE